MVESNTWELQVPLHRPGCCRSFCFDFFVCVFGGFLFVFCHCSYYVPIHTGPLSLFL